jgi:serine/threonine protein phosphatase PrpC
MDSLDLTPEPESPNSAPSKAERRAAVASAASSPPSVFGIAPRGKADEHAADDACRPTEDSLAGVCTSEKPAASSEVLGSQLEAQPDRKVEEEGYGSRRPSRQNGSRVRKSSRQRNSEVSEEDVIEPVRKQRPKKLWTNDSAIIRTISREGWDAISQQPFQAKPYLAEQLEGWTPVNVGQLLGFASQKGGKPQMPSQDEYAVVHEAGYQIYLVVDGHGESGEVVARFVRRWLVGALLALATERNDRVLTNGELTALFADLDVAAKKADATMEYAFKNSGCTATVAVVTPTRSLRGAWVGDCQCIVGQRHSRADTKSLTPPHVVQKSAGQNATRAIGHFSNAGLGHDAEEFVEADLDNSGLDFLVMGTGGFWRGMKKDNVAEEVSKAGPFYAQHACNAMATLSQAMQRDCLIAR